MTAVIKVGSSECEPSDSRWAEGVATSDALSVCRASQLEIFQLQRRIAKVNSQDRLLKAVGRGQAG